MQVKQEPLLDWHQKIIAELLKAPLVNTRVGLAFTSIGHLFKFNLNDSFPVTTAKKLFFEQVKRELFCFLKGYTSAEDLHKHGVTIWDADMERANAEDIGPIYGYQWRNWGGTGFDQLKYAANELVKTKGTTRRAIVSAWNPTDVLSDKAVLPPCHLLFQFNIVSGVLYTDVYQRSADAFLGLPFDVASFAIMSKLMRNTLLQQNINIIGEQLNYYVSNLHLYKEHEQAAIIELSNLPSGEKPCVICSRNTINNFSYKDWELIGYNENRIIKAKLLTG